MPTAESTSPLSQDAFEQALANRLRERQPTTLPALTTDEIRQGVPFERLDDLARRLRLTQATLTHVLGVSERTLQRRKETGRLSATESDRFERLLRIHQLALRAFDDNEDEARDWLTTPKRALDDETPVEHLDTEPGAQAVAEILIVIDQMMPA
jgi:putative toxin-antitoxin system antitoxin component (TIGR02293 family)